MIQHMFLGDVARRKESMENLQRGTIWEYGKRLKDFYGFIDGQIFGGMLTYALVALIVLFLWKIACLEDMPLSRGMEERERRDKGKDTEKTGWILAIGPCICYLLLVSRIAVYVTDRYLFPIYAIIPAAVTGLIYWGSRQLVKKNKWVLTGILLSAVIVNSWKMCSWPYLYKDSAALLETAEQYGKEDNLYVYDQNYKISSSFYEVSRYKSVTFFHRDRIEMLRDSPVKNNGSLVVTVMDSCGTEDILNKILEICPLLDSYKRLGSFGYATSYYLEGKNCHVEEYRIYDYGHEKLLGCAEAFEGKNIGITEDDSTIRGVFYQETGMMNLWVDNWVLDIKNGMMEEGNNIWLWEYNGSGAQEWKVWDNGDGTVSLVSHDEQFALTRSQEGDVCLGERKEGDISQKWWMEAVDS